MARRGSTDPGRELGGAVVAYDAAPARARPAGVGVYTAELGRRLLERAPANLRLIGVRSDAALAAAPGDGPSPSSAWSPFRGSLTQAWIQWYADRAARSVGADLVHYTNAAAPLRSRVPYVLTVHDLSLLRVPRSHPATRVATSPLLVAAIRGARHVLVPSAFTRDEVRRVLRVPAHRITVIPLAARTRRHPTEHEIAGVLRGHGLERGGYVLCASTLEPRKNHVRLLAAFERLAIRDRDLRLVLAGADGWGERRIHAALRRSPVRDRIMRLGYLDDERLAALIAGAGAFAYVSVYEGFGLPVVEALEMGVPVVTSSVASLPEVAGGRAVLVDPYDVDAIADGVEAALVDERWRRAAESSAGRRTWDAVADETLAVYRHVLERGTAWTQGTRAATARPAAPRQDQGRRVGLRPGPRV